MTLNREQAERMRLQSALTLQCYIRSYLARKRKKQEERLLFDRGDLDDIKKQLGKFLFFYERNIDKDRFVCITPCAKSFFFSHNNFEGKGWSHTHNKEGAYFGSTKGGFRNRLADKKIFSCMSS